MSDIMLKSYKREWPSLGVDSAIMDKDLARYIDLDPLTDNGAHCMSQRDTLPIPLQLGVKKK